MADIPCCARCGTARSASSFGLGGTCANHRNDLLRKLKLTKCAPISGLPEIGFFMVRKPPPVPSPASGGGSGWGQRCGRPRRAFVWHRDRSGSSRLISTNRGSPGALRALHGSGAPYNHGSVYSACIFRQPRFGGMRFCLSSASRPSIDANRISRSLTCLRAGSPRVDRLFFFCN